jgi:hypothetical protein
MVLPALNRTGAPCAGLKMFSYVRVVIAVLRSPGTARTSVKLSCTDDAGVIQILGNCAAALADRNVFSRPAGFERRWRWVERLRNCIPPSPVAARTQSPTTATRYSTRAKQFVAAVSTPLVARWVKKELKRGPLRHIDPSGGAFPRRFPNARRTPATRSPPDPGLVRQLVELIQNQHGMNRLGSVQAVSRRLEEHPRSHGARPPSPIQRALGAAGQATDR